MPTLKDCLFKASNHDAIFNACLTYAKYLPRSMNYILKSPVLPIHSNPCAIDSDGDGICLLYTSDRDKNIRFLDSRVFMQNLQKQDKKPAAKILDIDFNDAVFECGYYKSGVCS